MYNIVLQKSILNFFLSPLFDQRPTENDIFLHSVAFNMDSHGVSLNKQMVQACTFLSLREGEVGQPGGRGRALLGGLGTERGANGAASLGQGRQK